MEFRCPAPAACGYLSFTALMMAMIDGIQNKIDPGEPLDRDIHDMTATLAAKLLKELAARIAQDASSSSG